MLGLVCAISTCEPTVTPSIPYMEASTMEHIVAYCGVNQDTAPGLPATDGCHGMAHLVIRLVSCRH